MNSTPARRRSAALAVCMLLSALPVFSAGKFRVEGTKIFGPNGVQYIAKGANLNGYQANWQDEGKTIGDLQRYKDVWKFNFARLYCRLYKSDANKLGGKDQLYNIIETYIEAKVVVMMTYHDHTGGMYTGGQLDDLIEFNVDIVNRFKNHPDFTYLWFETMNEPGSRPFGDIDNMNRKFLKAIRDAGAKENIFCAPGNNYSQEGTKWDSSPVPESQSYILSRGKAMVDYNQSNWGNKNVIFSPHFYRIWIHGDAKMSKFIDDVYAKGLAMVVGEYGVGHADKPTNEATKSIVKVGYPRQIGRVVWHWSGKDNNKLVNKNGSSGRDIDRTNGSKPGNLTWLGGVVWDDNHRNENLTTSISVQGRSGKFRPVLSSPFGGQVFRIDGRRLAPVSMSQNHQVLSIDGVDSELSEKH